MKIEYNEKDKLIEIKDDLKTHYFIMRILMFLNLVSAIAGLYNVKETGFRFMEIIWVVIGIISLIVLYIFILF